jgi:hypothetical protein
VGTGALFLAIACAALLSPWPARPAAAQDTVPPCDASLWQHVYHPYRLKVINPCILVTGTIQEKRYEKDGDIHVLVRLDPRYDSLLNRLNVADERGDLVVEPVCEHAVTQADAVAACRGYASDIAVPSPGTRVRVEGSYVLDQDHGWMEIHPVTSLAPLGTAAPGTDTASSSAPAGSTRVWVNTHSGVYHCPGDPWYGRTKRGTYMSEAGAKAHGYRPAYEKPCGGRPPAANMEVPATPSMMLGGMR